MVCNIIPRLPFDAQAPPSEIKTTNLIDDTRQTTVEKEELNCYPRGRDECWSLALAYNKTFNSVMKSRICSQYIYKNLSCDATGADHTFTFPVSFVHTGLFHSSKSSVSFSSEAVLEIIEVQFFVYLFETGSHWRSLTGRELVKQTLTEICLL